MRSILPIIVLALGGCATSATTNKNVGAIYPRLSYTDTSCTDVIAANGGILKFCQDSRHLDVYESAVDARATPPSARLIDDPQVLSGLQSELNLRPEFAPSRRFVANSCAVGDKRYLMVSVESLKRILSNQAQRVVILDGPATTGSLYAPEPRMLDPR